MTVWIKQGVTGTPHREIRRAIGTLHDVVMPNDLYITSLKEGNHIAGSLHYDDKAVDIEARHILIEHARDVLGNNFDVVPFKVDGRQYIHVEYDPK